MQQALHAGDLAELTRLAHRLKGSAGNLGALRMVEICARIHAAAERSKSAQDCAPWLIELQQEFALVQAQLTEEARDMRHGSGRPV